MLEVRRKSIPYNVNPLICPGKLDALSKRKRNVNELAHSVLTDSDEIQPTPTSGGSTHMAHGDEIDSVDIRLAYDADCIAKLSTVWDRFSPHFKHNFLFRCRKTRAAIAISYTILLMLALAQSNTVTLT